MLVLQESSSVHLRGFTLQPGPPNPPSWRWGVQQTALSCTLVSTLPSIRALARKLPLLLLQISVYICLESLYFIPRSEVQKGQIWVSTVTSTTSRDVSPASALRRNHLCGANNHPCFNKIFFPLCFVPPSFSSCPLGAAVWPSRGPPGLPYSPLDRKAVRPRWRRSWRNQPRVSCSSLFTAPHLKSHISSQRQSRKVMRNIRAEWFIGNLFFNTWIPPLCFGSSLAYILFFHSFINYQWKFSNCTLAGWGDGRLSSSIPHLWLQGAIKGWMKRSDPVVLLRPICRCETLTLLDHIQQMKCGFTALWPLNSGGNGKENEQLFSLKIRDLNIKSFPLRNDTSIRALLTCPWTVC